MKLGIRIEVRNKSGQASRGTTSLLDLSIACSLLLLVVLFFPFLVANLFAFIAGSSSPDVVTGRTFEIALGWRHATAYYVTPWVGLIYDAVKIPLEIAGAAFLLLAGIKWFATRKNAPQDISN